MRFFIKRDRIMKYNLGNGIVEKVFFLLVGFLWIDLEKGWYYFCFCLIFMIFVMSGLFLVNIWNKRGKN